ncbi:hypothetical protein DSM112329_03419 [Paraconexibacter sp. AEG42_29]|uniref:histidine kinase n=1 Tax=Paraconexibacter sp. AEG42_29 TaxID=2997339 RepID=A0AAU7AXW0_9ACTN
MTVTGPLSSVRARVFAALAVTALVCTVLTVAVASVVLEQQAQDRRKASIGRVADVVSPLLPDGPRSGSGAAQRVRVFRLPALSTAAASRVRAVRGTARAAVLAAVGGRGPGATGFADLGGRRVVYAVRDSGRGRIVLIGPSGDRALTGPPPGRTVVLAGAGGLLLALLLGAVLTHRLTAPVAAVSRAAGEVAAGRTDLAVPETGPAEFQQLGRSFNAMVADLHQARDAERRFLTSVSHELKTPLTAVRGYAEAIGDGTIPSAQAAAVIGQEAARLERLVADLLDLARLRQADFTVARERIDLAPIVVDAVARHALAADALGVTLVAEAAGPAPAIGDTGRMLQVVSNLIENAVRVAAAPGTVTVTARPGRIDVRDDGPGLTPDELPHAFERFWLHDRLRSDRPVGSGLGLALVAELVAGMGGTVAVASEPRTATTFSVSLDHPGGDRADGRR